MSDLVQTSDTSGELSVEYKKTKCYRNVMPLTITSCLICRNVLKNKYMLVNSKHFNNNCNGHNYIYTAAKGTCLQSIHQTRPPYNMQKPQVCVFSTENSFI